MATQNIRFIPPVFLNWQSLDSLEKVLISKETIKRHVKFSKLQDLCVGGELMDMSDF